MQERVIVVGAGIAGLNVALALGRLRKHSVVLLERDSEPEDVPPGEAFFRWTRKGVPHFRQAHIFHPRLLNLYRSHQPALLEELFRAGARPLLLREALPAHMVAGYVPTAGDENCSLLLCRRATLEAVLRRHVARLSTVEIRSSTRVCGVIVDRSSDSSRIIGVQAKHACETSEILGDVIVDASGRMSKFPAWLPERGIDSIEETNDLVEKAYYTLYYRLREGRSEPTEFGRPVFDNGDSFSCNLYPADNGIFSVTFGFDMRHQPIRRDLTSPLEFHRTCETLPRVSPWVEHADPMSNVFVTAGFRNYWRTYVRSKKPLVSNFFAVGDALVHTNPGYGSGCSWAAEHARALAETLASTDKPADRAFLFDRQVRTSAYPFFSYMASSDRALQRSHAPVRRIEAVFDRRPANKVRVMASRVVAPAKAKDIALFRRSFEATYMIRVPKYWQDRLFVVSRLLLFWIKGGWIDLLTR